MKKPGSWNVLVVTMALSYALMRWAKEKVPYLILPFVFLIKFIARRYEEEIDAIGSWIKQRFQSLWRIIRRQSYVR